MILANELHFILVCKPDSHKILYQWIEELQAMNAVENLGEKKDGRVKPIISILIVLKTGLPYVMVKMLWKLTGVN